MKLSNKCTLCYRSFDLENPILVAACGHIFHNSCAQFCFAIGKKIQCQKCRQNVGKKSKVIVLKEVPDINLLSAPSTRPRNLRLSPPSTTISRCVQTDSDLVADMKNMTETCNDLKRSNKSLRMELKSGYRGTLTLFGQRISLDNIRKDNKKVLNRITSANQRLLSSNQKLSADIEILKDRLRSKNQELRQLAKPFIIRSISRVDSKGITECSPPRDSFDEKCRQLDRIDEQLKGKRELLLRLKIRLENTRAQFLAHDRYANKITVMKRRFRTINKRYRSIVKRSPVIFPSFRLSNNLSSEVSVKKRNRQIKPTGSVAYVRRQRMRDAEKAWRIQKLQKGQSRVERLLDEAREMQNNVLIYGLKEAKIESKGTTILAGVY